MIQVNHLEKSFEGFHALKGVDMHVEKGAIYGLVGPNGAGKSTLIRHITGVYKPDAGEVLIAGKPVYENKKVKAKFSYIPDEIFYFMQADTMEMKRFYQGIYPAFDEKLFYRMQEFFPNIDVKRSITSDITRRKMPKLRQQNKLKTPKMTLNILKAHLPLSKHLIRNQT